MYYFRDFYTKQNIIMLQICVLILVDVSIIFSFLIERFHLSFSWLAILINSGFAVWIKKKTKKKQRSRIGRSTVSSGDATSQAEQSVDIRQSM